MLTVGVCCAHGVLLEGVVTVWVRKAACTPLFWSDIPMEIHHGGNMLPASANDSCACFILADASQEPIVEVLQLLSDWFGILVVLLSAELLQGTPLVLICAGSS